MAAAALRLDRVSMGEDMVAGIPDPAMSDDSGGNP
jgi:hypothetical protein